MPPKKKRGKQHVVNLEACVFCGEEEDDEHAFGKKMSSSGVTVHYYCMLFASALCQSGKTDADGLLGFLVKDIMKEVNRGRRLKCSFCKKPGATVGCVTSSCKLKYHFGCGLRNEALYQYFGSYSSFCVEHRPRQAQPVRERLSFKGAAKTCCSICMCAVTARASNNTLRSPCCKNSWFHRDCIQSMAHSSGVHFFKCPLCNNKELFQEEMLTYGIYIPDQDAAWELEPNAYEDLLQRPNMCDVKKCLCPNGKEHSKLGSEWELMRCDYCGSKATHIKCSDLNTPMDDWSCQECVSVFGNERPKRERKPKKAKKIFPDNYLEEKFRKASKGKSPLKSKKRKLSCNSIDGESSPISGKKKRKRRRMMIKGFRIGEPKSGKPDKISNVRSDSNQILSSQIEDSGTIDEKLKNFLQFSPTSGDSEIEFNFSDSSLYSLQKVTIANKNKRPKTYKKRKKYKKTLKRALSVGNVLSGNCEKDVAKGLKRTKSLCQSNKLKGTSNKDIVKANCRNTKRSKKAKQSATEIKGSSVKNLPKWVQKMHEEDIITGKNLGKRFIESSPTSKKLSKKRVYSKKSCSSGVQVSPVSTKDTSVLKQILENHKTGCQEMKQLLMTDFISGKKLDCPFDDQSLCKNVEESNEKMDKCTNLSVPKARKSLSTDSGISLGFDERKSERLNKNSENKRSSKHISSQASPVSGSSYDSKSMWRESVERSPLTNISSNCSSPIFKSSTFNKSVQLFNTPEDAASYKAERGCDLDSQEVGRIRPSPSLSVVKTGRNSNKALYHYRKNMIYNFKKEKRTVDYDVNGNISPTKETHRKIKIESTGGQTLDSSDVLKGCDLSIYDFESDENSGADSVIIVDSFDGSKVKPTTDIPLISLEPDYDSETVSCEGDDLLITDVTIPKFKDFVSKNFMHKDDPSIIILDSSLTQDPTVSTSSDLTIDINSSLDSSSSSLEYISGVKQDSKSTGTQSVGTQYEFDVFDSDAFIVKDCHVKELKKTKHVAENVCKANTNSEVKGPSSFVMLGEVKDSKMCVIC